jgi:hypothetical protein
MKICISCKKENSNDSLYCYSCGTNIVETQEEGRIKQREFLIGGGDLLFYNSIIETSIFKLKNQWKILLNSSFICFISSMLTSALLWIIFSLYKVGINHRFRFSFEGITETYSFKIGILIGASYFLYYSSKLSSVKKINFMNPDYLNINDNQLNIGIISSFIILNNQHDKIRLIFRDDYVDQSLPFGLRGISDNYVVQKKYLGDRKFIDVLIADKYKSNVGELVSFLNHKATEIRDNIGY